MNSTKKATEAQTKVETAAAQVKSLADLYNVHANADEQTEKILRAQLEDAWKKFAAMATEFQKASVLSSVSGDAKDVLNKGETKYEVKSTGEKGWILSDEAKNGCLKDVAEFKVEKKDGKFVAKVYGADGKEMKIGQQLTVYRPIAKDVKVLSAKVDGKNVTFATSVRNGQNYVSVPVVY